MGEVKVKPLIWEQNFSGTWYAESVIGNYAVWDGYFRPPTQNAGIPAGAKLDETKAAAQADFEARIRSALLPDVSGMGEATVTLTKSQMDGLLMAAFPFATDDERQKNLASAISATPPASDLRAARNQAFREASNFIAEHQIAHTSNGDVLEPRGEGNKHGLAYAMAVAALQKEGK